MKKVLIFAGTTEGRHLADYASGLNIDTHIFVATEYGEMILKDDKSFNGNKCIIHTGRLDEAEIKEEIEQAIDEIQQGQTISSQEMHTTFKHYLL